METQTPFDGKSPFQDKSELDAAMLNRERSGMSVAAGELVSSSETDPVLVAKMELVNHVHDLE